jgi:hypothetical protein
MLSAIAELLLLTVPVNRFGMFRAVALPVIRIAGPPLPGAVAANLAVLRIGCDFLPVILGAALPLACLLAADFLARQKLRRLKGLLAIAAAPFRHNSRCRTMPYPWKMDNDNTTAKTADYFRLK